MISPVEPIDGVRHHPALVDDGLIGRINRKLLDPSTHDVASILIDGVSHPTPRLVSSYSDQVLRLEGMEESRIWTDELRELRDLVADELGVSPNYALANLYRDENDYTGWHSDKAGLHSRGSNIVIVSFGATRRLSFRPYSNPQEEITLELDEGSAVVMNLDIQATHEHTILREVKETAPRLSITFREIVIEPGYLPDACLE